MTIIRRSGLNVDAPPDGKPYDRKFGEWSLATDILPIKTENWGVITPIQNNSWHIINTPYVDAFLLVNMSSTANNRFLGVREVLSINDRRKRVDTDSPYTLPVKTDLNGDIGVYAQQVSSSSFRIASVEQ